MTKQKNKNILILGSMPYRKDSQSRAFDSYFGNLNSKNLHQFFSSPLPPLKGHCSEFYQMTDFQMLSSWLKKDKEKGNIFYEKNLSNGIDILCNSDKKSTIKSKLYAIGKKKTPLILLLRGLLWRKKYWLNRKFINWIDEFHPDILFLAWSDDFYMLKIAYELVKKYNIPIISCIGDDYYFNNHISFSPFYLIYKLLYKKLARKVLMLKGSHIYISDKIKDKYNAYFGIDGIKISVSNNTAPVSLDKSHERLQKFVYTGNLRLGRYKTLITFAKLMHLNLKNFSLSIYSAEKSKRIIRKLKNTPGILFLGKLDYDDLIIQMKKFDAILIVETLKNRNFINDVKYSLSTKVGDSLASGKIVVGVGNKECGSIDYLRRRDCAFVLKNKKEILEFSKSTFSTEVYKKLLANSRTALSDDFNLLKSKRKFETLIKNL